MSKELSKKEKKQFSFLGASVAIIILGLLFLVNAIQANPEDGFFKGFCRIGNVLGKYIIVIGIMSCGIMMFSTVAAGFENQKLRNRLTIGITIFAFILTLPLVYVFIAIFPYQIGGAMGPIGTFMGIDRISAGFVAWFGSGWFLWVVYVFMLCLSVVFLAEPLLAGILAVKGKALKLGKQPDGKKGFIGIIELPVLTKMKAAETAVVAEQAEVAEVESK